MNRSKKIIVEGLRKIISEGLIKSYDADKVIPLIIKMGINPDSIYQQGGVITIYAKIKYKDIITGVIERMENLFGWYLSGAREDFYEEMMTNTDELKLDLKFNLEGLEEDGFEDDDIALYLYFERKFDDEIKHGELPGFVYHVTDKKHLKKIKAMGLKPTHKDKLTHHPDRVYLSKTVAGANDLIDNDNFVIDEPVVLKVDISSLSGNKFYVDPNFSVDGFYTTSNIPPGFIVDAVDGSELVGESLEIISEDYPSSWDIEEFKKLTSFDARIKYCKEHLERIGAGTSRIVYKIDDEKVLKLAKNKKGVAQNEVEIRMSQDSYVEDIVAEVFEYDENNLWLEMELARRLDKTIFEKLTGFGFGVFCDAIYNYNIIARGIRGFSQRPMSQAMVDEMHEDEFISSVFDFIGSAGMPAGDLMRLSTYGIVGSPAGERIVIIDYGLDDDVLSSFY